MVRHATRAGTVGTLLRKALAAVVPRFASTLFNSYRPEKHYMRGPGPKTLGMTAGDFALKPESLRKSRYPRAGSGSFTLSMNKSENVCNGGPSLIGSPGRAPDGVS